MKKANFFILFALSAIILISFEVKAAENIYAPAPPPPAPASETSAGSVFQRLSLDIKDLKLNKEPASYNTGEKIEGSFKLKNNTNFFGQGIYYEIAIHYQKLDSETASIFFLDRSTLYDRVRILEPISFSPQEEKIINFSYQISKYFPASKNYYLQINVFGPREDILVNNFTKISIDNPTKVEKFILFDFRKSQVFGKDKMWALQEGAVFDYDAEYQPVKLITSTTSSIAPQQSKAATFEMPQVPEELKPAEILKNQVKAIIFYSNRAEEIQKPVLKIISYRYGAPLEEVFSKTVHWDSGFAKNSTSSFEIVLPLFKDPAAYETFLQFFDGDEKISNPLGVRYIISGDSGLVYDFLVEQKDNANFILNALFTAPADTYVRDSTEDIPAQFIFTVKEEKTNKICLSKMMSINLRDPKFLQEPFALRKCSLPLVFEAQLKKDGQILDEQKTTVQGPQPKPEKNYLAGIIVIAVLILVGLSFLLLKRIKKDELPPTIRLLIVIFVVSLIAILSIHSAKAETPPAVSWGAHTYAFDCNSGANFPFCHRGNIGYECNSCSPSGYTCGFDTCQYFERTDPFSWWGSCNFDITYCSGYGDNASCWTEIGSCLGRNLVRQTHSVPFDWSNNWSQLRFNDANDSDSSPTRFLYIKSYPLLGNWSAQDYSLNYYYDSNNNYFSVPSSDSYIRWHAVFHKAPNCGNGGGPGQGSMTAFILDEGGRVVKQLSTPPNWAITYQEGEADYWFSLSLAGLPYDKRYTLKIQDYKLFRGGQLDPVYQTFDYVSADFCYGNCTPPPTVDIKANGSDGPIAIPYNTSATISWSSANVDSCTISPTGWSGTSGSQSTGNLTSSVTYTANCNGPGGSASDSVTVNVGAPTLSVSLTANPNSGYAPLNDVVLNADVSGSAIGTISYTFWWDCDHPTTDVATAIVACGDPDGTAGNANGIKFDGISDDPKIVNHTYVNPGTYRAKVIAERGSLNAEDRVTVTVNLPPFPNPPSNLEANAVSCSQIDLTWQDNSPPDETRFELQRSPTGPPDSYSWSDLNLNIPPNTVTYSNFGLPENTRFYYQIRACNANGCSDYSNVANATTPPCPSSTTLMIDIVGSGSVNLNPPNLTCTSDCSQTYDHPEDVTLSVTPSRLFSFQGWSGDPDCNDGVVTMNADKTCIANFESNVWWKEVVPW